MGNFIFTDTDIEGVRLIDTKVFGDERGCFAETYREADFAEAGITSRFVQDNQSRSYKGVLRGLHFQIMHPQAKLVRVISGEVYDVAVDLRRGSKTYGRWAGAVLSGDNQRQMYIPRGFAHGFLVLSDTALFAYRCDAYYCPGDEGGIRFDDPDIGIQWDYDGEPILNERDRHLPTLKECGFAFDIN